MTDIEIIDLILSGDRDKYRLLVERHQQMVFRTCMGYLHNRDDADDLTQEVFIRAYQSLSRFRRDSAFSTWLYRIAINAALNMTRRPGNFIMSRIEGIFGPGSNDISEIARDTGDNPEELLIKDEHRKWIAKALESLPENQRTAIVLSKYDELPQKEIAQIMNTTEGAVEALIQRAKANLRVKLSAGMKKNLH
jgi:RNA polymerase sigma-70 factor (ECF subfamily)